MATTCRLVLWRWICTAGDVRDEAGGEECEECVRSRGEERREPGR